MKIKAIGNKLAVTVFVLGGVFMVIGVLRGEALEVLQKATIICLECIGIG